MSKSVRLPDYLAAEVERLAGEEKRSLANMVKVLLEQALTLNGTGNPTGEMAASSLPTEKAEPVPAAVNQSGDEGRRPKKRTHPCKHHVPPHRICDYCDV